MGGKTLKEKTATGLFWGGVSNTLQQVLSLLLGVFLARILEREEYGMVGMLTIFSLIANSLQESGFTSALAIKKEAKHKDFNAVFWFSLLMGVTLYLLLFLLAPFISQFYGIPELTPLARFIFLGFVFSSIGTAQSAYLFRHLMVKEKAIAQIIGLVISGTLGLSLAVLGYSYWSLAIQAVTYVGVVTLLFWWFSPWRPSLNLNFQPLRKMFSFSSKVLLTNIFNHINNNILTVLLGRLFAVDKVGDYTQASKWNNMSSFVIINMVNGVAQPVLAEASEEKERQKRVFRKMLQFTVFLSFPAMFGLSIVAEELIVLTITAKWLPSVPLLQMLCIWGAFAPIAHLYSHLIISKGKSTIYMWSVLMLGVAQMVLLLFVYSYGIRVMVASFVLLNISWLIVWHYFVQKEISYSFWEAIKDISSFLLTAGLVMTLVFYVTQPLDSLLFKLILRILMGATIYLSIIYILKKELVLEIVNGLLKIGFKKKNTTD